MNVLKSTTLPSSLKTRPPSSTHEQWSQPDEKLHLPDRVQPPSVSWALPAGADGELRRGVVGVPQMACCAAAEKSRACHGWTPTTLETQPVEPHAPAMSRTAV